MKILNEQPPMLNEILGAGMLPNETTIFTYGDTIYNPGGHELSDHLIEHEETHCDQQGNDPKKWWERYLIDPYFRIEQESEAYANQFAYICAKVKDRNQRAKICLDLARVLSGPLYGNIISQQNAYNTIKVKSKVKP